ncbi:alpha/beta fold hydrolase [Microcoleus sp. herbarium14]|uniref:alpha/beta hydrolase n=1 Tax=Microcoleus sp. herbarium14 TaxID=3055439 RepID=UPI002FD30CD2
MKNKKPNRLKLLFLIGKILAIAYIASSILLFVLQTRFIFQPTAIVQKTPDAFNIAYEEVWLPITNKSGKIEKLHGWWIPAQSPPQPPLVRGEFKQVLLYLHGRGFNIGANINQSYRFQQLGFSVLLIDYRGYGRSQGSFPNELQVYEDAETAYNYLVKQRQLSPSQVLLYGHSMGGTVAVELAIKHPEAAGLIVQSSFTSMADMVKKYPLMRIFPLWLLLTQKFDSISKVRSLRMPVLFVHGTADPLIPAAMSQKLYAAAPEPKQILLVPNAKHNNGDAFFNNGDYRQTVVDFAEKVIPRKQEIISNGD